MVFLLGKRVVEKHIILKGDFSRFINLVGERVEYLKKNNIFYMTTPLPITTLRPPFEHIHLISFYKQIISFSLFIYNNST